MTPARSSLVGRTAIVTGSTRGIGRAIAAAYARAGMRVVIHSRSPVDCEAVARELREAGGDVQAVASDLSDAAGVRTLARRATDALGRVDVLVNNAGQPMVGPSEELAETEWRRTLDLNLTGYFLLCQEVARQMIAERRGSIINVSSINGTVAFPRRVAYCVSKAGVNMMTKVLAIEWAQHGVRVNALAPGYIETEFVRGLAARGILDLPRLAQRAPIGRLGSPEEMVGAALYLASDESSYMTGAVLTLDGGWTAYGYV